MKQKTRKPKVANIGYVGTEIITGQSANPNVGAIPSRTSEVDYKQKYEQQKEEIHRLNSQVGGYKKNLNDSKDTIKALTADVNALKTIRLNLTDKIQSLRRKCEANDVFISQLETDLRISKDNISNLTNDLSRIRSKWWYKLFS